MCNIIIKINKLINKLLIRLAWISIIHINWDLTSWTKSIDKKSSGEFK